MVGAKGKIRFLKKNYKTEYLLCIRTQYNALLMSKPSSVFFVAHGKLKWVKNNLEIYKLPLLYCYWGALVVTIFYGEKNSYLDIIIHAILVFVRGILKI